MMKKITNPDFAGKVMQLSIAGDEHSYALESPRFEMQRGRLFLVGTVPRGGSTADWSEGVMSAVAWDQVTDYLVFNSAEEYLKRLSKFREHKRKS